MIKTHERPADPHATSGTGASAVKAPLTQRERDIVQLAQERLAGGCGATPHAVNMHVSPIGQRGSVWRSGHDPGLESFLREAGTGTAVYASMIAERGHSILLRPRGHCFTATQRRCRPSVRPGELAFQEGLARAALTKHVAADHATQIGDKALNALGGAGYYRRSPLERMYRDVRAGTIMPYNNLGAYDLFGKTSPGIEIAHAIGPKQFRHGSRSHSATAA